MRVYYLTSSNHALSNIALRRIKIARLSDLNDPFELLSVDLADREHRIAFRKMKEDLNKDNGLICFSKNWSNPLMWGHYAEKHTGICLGFDVPNKHLTPVLYRKSLGKIPVDPSTNTPIISEVFMNRLMRTKFNDWKYEKEIRAFIILNHLTQESGLYYKEFDDDLALREIILGPRCELPIARVRAMVDPFYPKVEVIKSRIAFRSYRIIKFVSASK